MSFAADNRQVFSSVGKSPMSSSFDQLTDSSRRPITRDMLSNDLLSEYIKQNFDGAEPSVDEIRFTKDNHNRLQILSISLLPL
jgi:hypothetical protein